MIKMIIVETDAGWVKLENMLFVDDKFENTRKVNTNGIVIVKIVDLLN